MPHFLCTITLDILPNHLHNRVINLTLTSHSKDYIMQAFLSDYNDVTELQATDRLETYGFTWNEFIAANPTWAGNGREVLVWMGY